MLAPGVAMLLVKCKDAYLLGEATVERFDRRDMKDAAFDVVLRGYDKRQVDERLRVLGSELAAAQASLRAAHERAAMLADEVSQARARSGADPPSESNFGARVEKILMMAEAEARQVRSQADAAAAALVERARAEAAECSAEFDNSRHELERESEQVRAQVRAEAEQIRRAVAQEVDGLFKAARADADEVGKAARAEAAQVVAQARAEANRLVAAAAEAAQQRERASAHELHQLSRLRDEINADLYRAKEILDGLFGTTRPTPAARLEEGAQDRRHARTV